MKLSREYVKNAAREFLEVLDIWDINSCEDLEKKVGSFFSFDNTQGRIELTLIPGTMTYSLKYKMHGAKTLIEEVHETDVPLALYVNPKVDSTIRLKAQERIEGYTCYKADIFGNIPQIKEIYPSEFSKIKEELVKLCE